MKPSAIRIERMLEKIEAALVPPPRPCLVIITHQGDDAAAAMEKALAEHVACHPEDAGRTVKDFRWIEWEIVQSLSAAEISKAEISAAAARDEISKGEIEDEFPLNGCKGPDGPSETLEPIDLPPPDPGCLEPLEREPIDRMRARLEALLKANAAPRCGARSKRTGKPCRGAAMPNGRCKLHGGKSTGPRTPEGLERSRRANWKHGYYSREAKAERSRVRAAILALRYLRMLGH